VAKLTGGCVGKSGVGTRPSAAEGRRTVSAAGAGGGVCDGWVDSAGFRSGPGVASARLPAAMAPVNHWRRGRTARAGKKKEVAARCVAVVLL
jgi:hypothetical protein